MWRRRQGDVIQVELVAVVADRLPGSGPQRTQGSDGLLHAADPAGERDADSLELALGLRIGKPGTGTED